MRRVWISLACCAPLIAGGIAPAEYKQRRADVRTSPMRSALALVFGGALGNLWDRLFHGTVTDFLQFFFGSYEFPSFNAADTMIDIGAGLLSIASG